MMSVLPSHCCAGTWSLWRCVMLRMLFEYNGEPHVGADEESVK